MAQSIGGEVVCFGVSGFFGFLENDVRFGLVSWR